MSVMLETQVPSMGQEEPLEKEMATHSSILAWRIPWTEEPGGLQSIGSPRVRHDLGTKQQHLLPQVPATSSAFPWLQSASSILVPPLAPRVQTLASLASPPPFANTSKHLAQTSSTSSLWSSFSIPFMVPTVAFVIPPALTTSFCSPLSLNLPPPSTE